MFIKNTNSYSKEGQDYFALYVNKFKENGTFVEIGSNDAIKDNNSYFLEKKYNWRGLLVEYDPVYMNSYIQHRTSNFIIQDGTTIDYKTVFAGLKFPNMIDYLQIDLDENNGSTLKALELFDKTIFNNYTFNAITFEHDIYASNSYNTRIKSRDIFKKNGYILVFPDVKHSLNQPFEDWYVHESVGLEFINSIKTDKSLIWMDIMQLLHEKK